VGSRNITANVIAPGFFLTDMTKKLPPEAQEAILARIPLKRYGKPEDIAELVAFLASERAGYITAQVICIDGGVWGWGSGTIQNGLKSFLDGTGVGFQAFSPGEVIAARLSLFKPVRFNWTMSMNLTKSVILSGELKRAVPPVDGMVRTSDIITHRHIEFSQQIQPALVIFPT
jgi:hypothetical protein